MKREAWREKSKERNMKDQIGYLKGMQNVDEVIMAKLIDKHVSEPNKEKILDMKRPEVTGTLKGRETIETMMIQNIVTKVTAKTKTKVKSM